MIEDVLNHTDSKMHDVNIPHSNKDSITMDDYPDACITTQTPFGPGSLAAIKRPA